MRAPLPLLCHPSCPIAAVEALDASAWMDGDRLRLVYALRADLGALRVPGLGPAERRDGLWTHTCFEAFLMPEGGEAYLELNLSPEGAWAAYALDGYRRGLRPLSVAAPRIQVRQGARELGLEATLELPAGLRPPFRLGLSAVLEDAEGGLHYWALRHAPGAPDFHADAAFCARLEA